MAFEQSQSPRRIRAALEMMRKAVIALLVLIGAGPAMADALPRLPNEFQYWRLWAECSVLRPHNPNMHVGAHCL